MVLSEKQVQRFLYEFVETKKKHTFISPNVMNLFPWECDIISLTNSNLIHEYEIKINKTDFLNDVKKPKHKTLLSNKKKPSYFWYVNIGFETDLKDIPDYAGLITGEVFLIKKKEKIIFKEIKKAPRLSNRKITPTELHRMYRSIYFRYWNQRKILLD